MKNATSILFLFLILCVSVLTAACTGPAGPSGNTGKTGAPAALQQSSHPVLPGPSYSMHPHTVPVETAYNETVATFWSFAIAGPYNADPNWTAAHVDPDPVVIAETNGSPEYYEFSLKKDDRVVGYFWTAANRILGHTIFRIYPSAPAYNHSAIAQDAVSVVRAQNTGDTVLSVTPGLYGGSYPLLCSIITVRNASTGQTERIVVDAFTHAIVPDHYSEESARPGYAWSYFDIIPESEWPARIEQWRLADTNATAAIDYAMARGIDPRLPLSEKNVSIIRGFYGPDLPDPQPVPGASREITPESMVTDKMLEQNIVPVEAARASALVYLWRAQLDRPDINGWPSWRNASLNMTAYTVIEDIGGRPYQYLFFVEHGGKPAGEIVVGANKALGGRYGGTGRGDYDIPNASRTAREILDHDFPGYHTIYERPVSAIGENPGVWVFLLAEATRSPRMVRIAVNTESFEILVENASITEDPGRFPSAFTKITRQDLPDALDLWEQENAEDRKFLAFAQSQGISGEHPLTEKEIISLGTHLFRSDPQYRRQGELYNPLSGQGAGPALGAETRRWHDESEWFSAILVDASLDRAGIDRILRDHALPGNYTLDIHSRGSMGSDYYLDVPEPDYDLIFSRLRDDGSAWIVEPISPMAEYVQGTKKRNGSILLPVAVSYPVEANTRRLISSGLPLKTMREVYIQYDYPNLPKKADRERVLRELAADDRVLFALREYPG